MVDSLNTSFEERKNKKERKKKERRMEIRIKKEK